MVAGATDIGQLRAIADILGHSPDMLMKTYAHAMPQSTSAVVKRIGERTSQTTPTLGFGRAAVAEWFMPT